MLFEDLPCSCTWYTFFDVWLLLLSKMVFRFIHVACISSLFFFGFESIRCVNISQYLKNYSHINQHLGSFQIWALKSKTTINIYVCLWVDIYFILHHT